MDKAIIAKNISKKYKLYSGAKERILDLLSPKSYGDDFHALRNVSFEAEKGDVVGFVGINGSGKSTLSNIIAGIVPQTSGSVKTNGQVSLIAVASGLKGELTGRDNIELKCLMLGFSKEEIKRMEPDIIDFSELGNFIDQPVKSYSSGMKSRLGFAISVNVNPDVLIIDEALSVGDKAFAEKSLKKMKEFKEDGKTMIFVSHSIGQMKRFCEKILWLEYGMVRDYGTVKEVMPKYEAFLQRFQKLNKKEREKYKEKVLNYGFTEDAEPKPLTDAEDSKANLRYKEDPISRLGHISAGVSQIYEKPENLEKAKHSKQYKNKVYYIKKQATYLDEVFYLLSEEPSAKDGVIGWMKASDVSSHNYVEIDTDPKTFYVKGSGTAFDRPWGGKKNLVFADLNSFKDKEFKVSKTVKVGKNVWYYGMLNGEKVWMHGNTLKTM